ncbi:hypothetical protein QC764_0059260 [Podospora pseudoanserina]|uniref:DUF7708 domain-containing protein n=1 Tax=Podospora pseudoanserina TaxID=2609844 RepID=A0ABR0IF74_9PEZI|nr:hypothetical protein QC764_0059260 [Podospora pseudoanserina]
MNSSFTTTPETTTIIRSYSLKVGKENPSNVLSQALGSATKHDEEGDLRARVTAEEWHRWLYGPSPTSDASIFSPLEREREELIRVWQEFQRIFVNPGADNISALDSHRIPTIATLQAAVEDAHTNWEVKHQSGFGRAKTRFREFIETMNDHSYLFKFVPAQDKYLSLLTGVVATVVKASLNYQKIAEGFSLALVEMSANLRYVEKKTHIANTAEMQRLVVELYVKIFKFLCHAMSFFHKRRKRFFASFDKTFYDRSVQAMVDDIQKTIKRIKDEAQHTSELRIEEINSKVDWLVRLQELGTHSHGNSQQEIDDKNATAAIGFKRLGETAVRHLGLVEEQVRLCKCLFIFSVGKSAP